MLGRESQDETLSPQHQTKGIEKMSDKDHPSVTTVPVGPEPKWVPSQKDMDRHDNAPKSPKSPAPKSTKW
jgi:hypothetical protein